MSNAIDFSRLRLQVTKEMGRGVFAVKRYRKGDLIERCPVLPLTRKEERLIQRTSLRDYTFAWGKWPGTSCIVLGWGALYNHSNHPNAIYRQRKKHKQMDFIALRDIKKGEQIFIDYEWDAEEYIVTGIQVTRVRRQKPSRKPP